METIRIYYRLTKPGIVYGNALAAVAAFIFASDSHINFTLLILMLVGISAIIAASCVVNNVLDRDIDGHMERTKERALVTGKVSVRNALLFAAALGLIGVVALLSTTPLALLVALFGVIVYVCFYTPLKRITHHSTIVGAFAGATPPVVGYVAVTNSLDTVALSLFLILVCWQMVHFLAIAIFRKDDYAEANLPVMSVRFSILRTKLLMIAYAFLFAYAALGLYVSAKLGLIYTVPLSLLSLGWILLSIVGFYTKDTTAWARRMFFYSLIVLLIFCLALALS